MDVTVSNLLAQKIFGKALHVYSMKHLFADTRKTILVALFSPFLLYESNLWSSLDEIRHSSLSLTYRLFNKKNPKEHVSSHEESVTLTCNDTVIAS